MEAISSLSFLQQYSLSLHFSSLKAKSPLTIFTLPKKQTPNQITFATSKNSPPSIPNNQSNNLLTTILNSLEDLISNFLDLPLHPSIDPKHVLSTHTAPVEELPPTACQVVVGCLPSCLDGAYIRNGPNPQFPPKGPYHAFEGDGMLHMIRISQGKATFCCRYVSTHKHAVERKAGYPFVPGVFSSFNGVAATLSRTLLTAARVLAKQFDPLNHGYGTANTSLSLFANQIFALCESDLPYAVKVTPEGDITTLRRHDFEASEPFLRMTAHPKLDRATGEAFAYSYDVVPPFLTLFRIDSAGRKQKGVPIFSMEGCACIHDFGVTQNYVVFGDIQMVVNPWRILRGRSPVGVDQVKVPRVGVIGKYAEDERGMWWVDVPGLNIVHCVNAWEEEGGCTISMVGTNSMRVEKILEDFHSAELRMEKITIDMKERRVQRQPLSHRPLELGVINPAYAAMKSRYVYAAIIGPTSWAGVVKLDISLCGSVDGGDCTVASHLYEPGCRGSEPFFVSREPNNLEAEEDDGYIVTYVHDENTDESSFLVLDAKSPNLDIIALVKLPQRIPDGFHGLFVSESDLRKL